MISDKDEIYIDFDEDGNKIELVKIISGEVFRDQPSFVKK